MFLDKEQLDQIEDHITEILPDLLRRNPQIATTIEGILAQHFPRRDEFARLLDEFTGFRQETRHRFDRVDQDIHELKTDAGQLKLDVGQLKLDVGELKTDVGQLKTDVGQLKTDVGQLKTDVGRLDGRTLQQQVRERIPVYLSRFALRLRLSGSAEVAELLEEAVEQGRISEKEMDDAKLIDAVARGCRRTDNVNIYLAAEISTVIDLHDLARAMRRAAVIERATSVPTIPIVVGEEIRQDARTQADAVNAGWVVLPSEG